VAALTFKVGGDTSGLGTATNKAKGMLSGLATFAKGAAIGGMLAGAAASVAYPRSYRLRVSLNKRACQQILRARIDQ